MKTRTLLFTLIILLSAKNSGLSADLIEERGYLRNIQVIGETFIYTDNYYSAIYSYENGQIRTLTDTRGSGLYYSIAPDKKTVGYKAIDAFGRQRPALLNIETGGIRYLYEATDHAGQPSFTDNGSIAFTVANRLIISDGREYDLGVYSHIAPLSPDGRYVCYNDDGGNLRLMNLDNLEKSVISGSEGGYYYPQWSADSRNILYLGFNGKIWIYDLETGANRNIATGHEPRWSPDGRQVVFYQKEIENFELINSDLYIIDRDGSNLRRLTDSGDRFEMDPAFSADGTQIVYHTYGQNEIHLGSLNQTKSSISAEKILKVTIAGRRELTDKYPSVDHIKGESEGLPVPYLHQVYDVPDWFWGYYACAPTTAAMLLAYHNILPKWRVTCASPYRHTSLWGRYICERYFYREQDYNYSSSPAGHTAGKGGYGYMWGTGGSPNSRMANYYEKHGMNADQDSEQTSWLKAVNNINSGNPYTMCVWLTSSGHLVLAKGIVDGKKTLIFNDPYGNKNTPGYPSYDGEGARYDWPGYNEGNVNLASAGSGIPWIIATTYSSITRADTLVDDKQLEKGFYLHAAYPASMAKWRDKIGGYHNHYWYCYSRQSTDTDTSCYATWTPDLPELGWYSVYAYIPGHSEATTGAVYHIQHSDTVSLVPIDQSLYSDEWVRLGHYIFHSGPEANIRLGDGCAETGKVVLFDAVKWVPERSLEIDFTANNTTGPAPLTVRFTNLSEYLPADCQLRWDFGDGNVNNPGDNPVHIYREAGEYDVRLTILYPDTVLTIQKFAYIQADPPFPGDFSLIVPEANSVLRTATPLFFWVPTPVSKSQREILTDDLKNGVLPSNPVSNVAYDYQLFLHTNSDFRETVPIDVDTNFYRPEYSLEENREYFWRVQYVTGAGDTLCSAIWSFGVDVQNSAPQEFAVDYPVEDEVLVNLAPEFRWNASEDPDFHDSLFYRMKIGTGRHQLHSVYEGHRTKIVLNDSLWDNQVYYWQVEAVDRAGAVTIANGHPIVFYTNVENEAPAPPILKSPKNCDYVFTQYPVFEWLPATDPDPNDEISYYLRYWPVESTVRYVYPTDTTYCDIRRLKYNYEYYWCVEAEDRDGLTAISDTFLLNTSSSAIDEETNLPEEFALNQNVPNPFNPQTTIEYDLPEESMVTLTIYDITGREVAKLVDRKSPAGFYKSTWDGRNKSGIMVSSGVYIYRIQARSSAGDGSGSFSRTKKMIFMR